MINKRKSDSVRQIVTDLLDDYPKLARKENIRKLVWCVWAELGFVKDYHISYKDYLSAPTVATIRRARRKAIADYPPYINLSNK